MKNTRERQRGFTLIELVVVIAILGVLAAISVPLITNYLGQAKERAYNTDVEVVQAAIDAHYSAPDNERFIGTRQYAIYGTAKGSSDPAELATDDDEIDDATSVLDDDSPRNPLGGTVGGSPVWDDTEDNGIRDDSTDEPLSKTDGSGIGGKDSWRLVKVTRETTDYYVDTRDYIIDMKVLVDAGLLDGVPNSASADNCQSYTTPSDCTGSYIYYLDSDGKVQTLLSSFPTPDKTGFQDGVHP